MEAQQNKPLSPEAEEKFKKAWDNVRDRIYSETKKTEEQETSTEEKKEEGE